MQTGANIAILALPTGLEYPTPPPLFVQAGFFEFLDFRRHTAGREYSVIQAGMGLARMDGAQGGSLTGNVAQDATRD